MKIRWQQLKRIFSGHASREDWWVSMLGVVMLVLVAYFAKLLFDGVFPAYSQWSTAFVTGIAAIAWIPVSIRRLRDFDASPYLVLAGYVPLLNLGLLWKLGFQQSSRGVWIAQNGLQESMQAENVVIPVCKEQLSEGRRGAAFSNENRP